LARAKKNTGPQRELSNDPALIPKAARFVEEFVKDLNGAAAGRRAGSSAKTAKVIASQLLNQTSLEGLAAH
jgi:phage terminase small subunit